MGYLRSKKRVEAASDWSKFVARNMSVVEEAGLPPVVTESIKLWDDFLIHGYIDHHRYPTDFSVDQLTDEQYTALLQFVDSYFAQGYEYFTPTVLRVEDSKRLELRYRNG
jgi:hypothetical protein